ncbi:MAG: TetR family transcriptional regulator [Vicinamibacterales bacterium]
MARPRNADGQRTRQALLDAALDLFAEKGYFGTSLRDVASAVGVRESAIYNYFPSKEGLFEALILADQHTKLERLASIAEAPITDVRDVLEQLAVSSLESFAAPRQRKLFRILMSDGIRLAKVGRMNLYEQLATGRDRLHAVMRRLTSEGWLRTADAEALAISFIGPLNLWRQLHAIDADLAIIRDPRAFARQHVDQFLRGAAVATRRSVELKGSIPQPVSRRAASARAAKPAPLPKRQAVRSKRSSA